MTCARDIDLYERGASIDDLAKPYVTSARDTDLRAILTFTSAERA